MRQARRMDGIAMAVAAIPLLAAVLRWPALPDQLAVHWQGNTPDTFLSKPLGTLGIYALFLGTLAFVRLAPDSITNTPGGENVTVLFLGVVFAWVEMIVLLWNLGLRFSVELATVPILVLTAGLLWYASRRG